jgi:hypothetical protein
MGVNWVVCGTVAEGCGEPSNLRTCRECDAQVCVPVPMTPLVESGELRPICWSCHRATARSLTLHPLAIKALNDIGRLEEGWRLIAEINEGTDDEWSS